jgi:hypothetical protein
MPTPEVHDDLAAVIDADRGAADPALELARAEPRRTGMKSG